MSTAHDRLLESEDGRRELCVEQTITNITELICKHLDESEMSRTELARQMGVTPGRITQLLDGDANLTLRSIARALAAFGHVLSGRSEPIVRTECVGGWTLWCVPRLTGVIHAGRAEEPVTAILDGFRPLEAA